MVNQTTRVQACTNFIQIVLILVHGKPTKETLIKESNQRKLTKKVPPPYTPEEEKEEELLWILI